MNREGLNQEEVVVAVAVVVVVDGGGGEGDGGDGGGEVRSERTGKTAPCPHSQHER